MTRGILYLIELVALGITVTTIHLSIKPVAKTLVSFGEMMPSRKVKSWYLFLLRPDSLSWAQICVFAPLILATGIFKTFTGLTSSLAITIILILWLLSAFFDALDGAIARQFPWLASDKGPLLDSISDKIIVATTAIVCLLALGFNFIDFLLIILVDIIRVIATFIQHYYNKRGKLLSWEVAANIWGKLKRNAQVAALAMFLLSPRFNKGLVGGLIYVTVFTGIMSFVGHVAPRFWLYRLITNLIEVPCYRIYHSASRSPTN